MLSEGLCDIDNSAVIIGITEGEEVESLDVLLQVSDERFVKPGEGFSLSAKVFLLEYCKVKFGYDETEAYLQKHRDAPGIEWALTFFYLKNKWSFEPDQEAKALIQAICDGTEQDIINAVKAGGRIMTNDMLMSTIPFSNLSDEILKYLFANAMSLKLRCLGILSISQEIPNYSNTKMYDVLCNMVTILVNLLMQDKGIVA